MFFQPTEQIFSGNILIVRMTCISNDERKNKSDFTFNQQQSCRDYKVHIPEKELNSLTHLFMSVGGYCQPMVKSVYNLCVLPDIQGKCPSLNKE